MDILTVAQLEEHAIDLLVHTVFDTSDIMNIAFHVCGQGKESSERKYIGPGQFLLFKEARTDL